MNQGGYIHSIEATVIRNREAICKNARMVTIAAGFERVLKRKDPAEQDSTGSWIISPLGAIQREAAPQ
jgi:hypothetical protein